MYLGKGYEAADDWAALFASWLILYNSYSIFRPALGEIMDENLYEDLIDTIRQESQKVKGVVGTEKCLMRKAGVERYLPQPIPFKQYTASLTTPWLPNPEDRQFAIIPPPYVLPGGSRGVETQLWLE